MGDLGEKGKQYMDDAKKKLSGSKGFLGGMFGSVIHNCVCLMLPVTCCSLSLMSHLILFMQHQCLLVPAITCNMIDVRIIVAYLSLVRLSLHMIILSLLSVHRLSSL